MSEHCVINGNRCSKCCEVLTIGVNKNFRDWMSYAKNNTNENCSTDGELDFYKVAKMVIPISKRRAKKKNPFLIKQLPRGKKANYFTCSNFTGSGCGDYENRPRMCSEYPYYGLTKSEFLDGNKKPDYDPDCTWFVELT